ncbi:uncharacterized protein LOC128553187 [Mercenaria mercenaria]|uniref:uncharacterized protein LOC128553187 n=1 Tax=Mercenaria mercenaria TaxID=6596 RepID=UPI00234E4CE2|nr:uncharacterized protein LOC128553187 [Mercenaria mercenaria]
MKEAADILKEAQKQKDEEFQHMKEQLKKAEKELQLLRRLRTAFQRNKSLKEKKESLELVWRLGIRVVTPPGDSASEVIQRVYGFIQFAVKSNRSLGEESTAPSIHTYKKTFKSVKQILGKIIVSQDTKLEVLQCKPGVSFKIQCITTKDFEQRLTIFHGIHFQEAVANLRKCLEMEDDQKRKYEVTSFCSSQTLKDIKKQLSDHGVLKGSSSDIKCERHDSMQCSWYCGEHDLFFCKSCKEKNHRSCFGLKKIEERKKIRELKLNRCNLQPQNLDLKSPLFARYQWLCSHW